LHQPSRRNGLAIILITSRSNTNNPAYVACLSGSILEERRALNLRKGLTMKLKRIAQTLLVASLSTTAMGALAATTPDYPTSVEPVRPLIEEFPNIDTYKKEHRNSAVEQAPMTYPAEVLPVRPLSGEFPNMQTYEDLHKNAPVAQSDTPTFPYSVDPVRSMAEEGLVPGIPGVAPYVDARNQSLNESTRTAQGATR
jgi:hypothetical protein